MKKLLTILFFLSSLASFATGIKRYPGRGGDLGYYANAGTGFVANPGDTLVLRASEARTYFQIDNLHGTAAEPIVVTNEGGQVTLTAMGFVHGSYIKVDGAGTPGTTYGFYIDGNGSVGPAMNIQGRSRCIELSFFKTYRTGYIVWAKTDPSCVDSTNYPNWIMDSIKIHDFYSFNVGQDGVYAGNTSPRGITFGCGHKYPMLLKDFEIYNGYIDSVNRTAIQLGLCENGSIHDNYIRRIGYEYNQAQGNGISIGGISKNIHVFDNDIKYTFLNGILNFGRQRNFVENNVVDSSGFLPIDPFNDIDSLLRKRDTILHIENSTWNTSFYHFSKTGHTFINTYSQPACLVMQPDWNDYGTMEGTTLSDSSTQVWRNNHVGVSVVVDATYNYIGGNSNKLRIINQGKNPIGYFNYICNNLLLDNVTLANIAPDGQHYFTDCSSIPSLAPSAYAGVDQTITLPTAAVTLNGIGTPSSGNSITSYFWEKLTGPATYTITSNSSASTTVTGLVEGTYTFRLTVTQSDEQTATSTMSVTVNAAAGVFNPGGRVRGALGGGFILGKGFKIIGNIHIKR
jgi:hypothetical protein